MNYLHRLAVCIFRRRFDWSNAGPLVRLGQGDYERCMK